MPRIRASSSQPVTAHVYLKSMIEAAPDPGGASPSAEQAAPQREPAEVIADQIRQAALLPPEEQTAAFAALRLGRQINVTYERNDETALATDDAIILLVENGEDELAARLITPSLHESSVLDHALLRRHPDAFLQGDPIYDKLEQIRIEKSAELKEQFRAHMAGMPSEDVDRLLMKIRYSAADPDSALEAPASFWHSIQAMPEEAQSHIIGMPTPLNEAAEALPHISHGGLLRYAKELLPTVMAIKNETARDAFITSLSNIVREMQQLDPPVELTGHTLQTLSRYRDPQQAMTLARNLTPNEHPNKALTELDYQLGRDGLKLQPDQLYKIPETIAAALPHLYETLNTLGVPSYMRGYTVRALNLLQQEVNWPVTGELTVALTKILQIQNVDPSDPFMWPSPFQVEMLKELNDILAPRIQNERADPNETVFNLEMFMTKMNAAFKHYMFVKEAMEKARSKATYGSDEVEPNFIGDAGDAETTKETTADKEEKWIRQNLLKIRRHSLGVFFDNLGIPEKISVKMFGAWDSYDPIIRIIGYPEDPKEEQKLVKAITDEQIADAALHSANRLYARLNAVQEYQKAYGTEELLDLHNTFGIVHFSRAPARQFHNQMLRWNGQVQDENGTITDTGVKEPAVNMNVACTDDHNDAFSEIAGKFFADFGEEGSFYFEASKRKDVSRAIVKVGDRERAAGRNPEEDSFMEIVMVSGHGSPRTVQLGPFEEINLAAYTQAMLGMNKLNDMGGNAVPNDYSRHIGHGYRVILNACSAGKKVVLSINISEMINATTGAPVEASPEDSYGYIYNKDTGEVKFRIMNEAGQIVPVDSNKFGEQKGPLEGPIRRAA